MTREFTPSTPRADALRAAIPRFRLLPVADGRDPLLKAVADRAFGPEAKTP